MLLASPGLVSEHLDLFKGNVIVASHGYSKGTSEIPGTIHFNFRLGWLCILSFSDFFFAGKIVNFNINYCVFCTQDDLECTRFSQFQSNKIS